MSYQRPSQLSAILASIQQLSPGERRLLQRRLYASGLLEPDELLTDQDRLAVAPALGTGIEQWRTDASTTVKAPEMPETAILPPVNDALDLDEEADEYRSAVSGKVVMGPPTDIVADDPHAMRPVPGQAPDQPIVVVFDGGSKGNPGRGYGSYALNWPGQTEQIVRLQFGDKVTNNEAEYDTLIAALDAVLARLDDLGAAVSTAQIEIFGDSLLVINQVKGEWKCKQQRLQLRRDRVRESLAFFDRWHLEHHDRSKSVEVLGH